nr:unnamed protein product [Haemonchus contortus]
MYLNNLARPSSATHTPVAGSLAHSPVDDTAVVEVEEAQEQPDRREMDRISSKEMERRPSAESGAERRDRDRSRKSSKEQLQKEQRREDSKESARKDSMEKVGITPIESPHGSRREHWKAFGQGDMFLKEAATPPSEPSDTTGKVKGIHQRDFRLGDL